MIIVASSLLIFSTILLIFAVNKRSNVLVRDICSHRRLYRVNKVKTKVHNEALWREQFNNYNIGTESFSNLTEERSRLLAEISELRLEISNLENKRKEKTLSRREEKKQSSNPGKLNSSSSDTSLALGVLTVGDFNNSSGGSSGDGGWSGGDGGFSGGGASDSW